MRKLFAVAVLTNLFLLGGVALAFHGDLTAEGQGAVSHVVNHVPVVVSDFVEAPAAPVKVTVDIQEPVLSEGVVKGVKPKCNSPGNRNRQA